MENLKYLPLSVYQFPLGNCGGVTDHVKTIYVPNLEGFMSFDQIEDKSLIFVEDQRSSDYWALKPAFPVSKGHIMAGGNLAYSSDSRCKRVYHIHDRIESQEVYDGLSV